MADGVSILPERRLSPFASGFLGALVGVAFMLAALTLASAIAAIARGLS